MIKASILFLCKPKYNNYRIYAQNLAYFDAIFLLKILVQLGKVEPLIS